MNSLFHLLSFPGILYCIDLLFVFIFIFVSFLGREDLFFISYFYGLLFFESERKSIKMGR